MPSVEEAATGSGQLAATLRAGMESLSADQKITFVRYTRLVLPLDGFVFWVKDGLVNQDSTFNSSPYNRLRPNQATSQPADDADDPSTVTVEGVFHYASDSRQVEDENFTVNRVIFTSETEIQKFNNVADNVIWIGQFKDVRFAFSSRGSYFMEADLYHYVGEAIYAAMETQIIDTLAGFDTRNVIVSNSLPFWLSLNGRQQLYPFPAKLPVELFPAFLVPENMRPPFGSVEIVSTTTEAFSASPSFDNSGTTSRLVKERVKITLYGLRNFNAQDFVDFVLNTIGYDGDPVGLINMPVIRDEKRTQNELNILAQKKSIEFEVSYYQGRLRDVVLQRILIVIPSFNISED